jgi:hypothetical protein
MMMKTWDSPIRSANLDFRNAGQAFLTAFFETPAWAPVSRRKPSVVMAGAKLEHLTFSEGPASDLRLA